MKPTILHNLINEFDCFIVRLLLSLKLFQLFILPYRLFKHLIIHKLFLIQFTIADTEPAKPNPLMECKKEKSTVTGTLLSVPAGDTEEKYAYYVVSPEQLEMDMGWITVDDVETIFECAKASIRNTSDSKFVGLLYSLYQFC